MITITTELLIQFTALGILANIVSFGILGILLMNRISNLSFEDDMEHKFFMQSRFNFQIYNTPLYKTYLKHILVILPFYYTTINVIFLYYLMKYRGVTGVIFGTINSEKYQMVQTVQYKVTNINSN